MRFYLPERNTSSSRLKTAIVTTTHTKKKHGVLKTNYPFVCARNGHQAINHRKDLQSGFEVNNVTGSQLITTGKASSKLSDQ